MSCSTGSWSNDFTAQQPLCPFGGPPPPGPGCWFGSPPPYPAPCSSVPPPPPPSTSSGIPRPPPPTSQSFAESNDPPEPPLESNSVNGQLATFPNRSVGYIFPKYNVTIHLFVDNILIRNTPVENIVSAGNAKKQVQHAPCDMTFEELIERLDCKKRANTYAPYNVPGQGYPEDNIGIQELFLLDSGRFMLGSRIMLGSPSARHKLGDLWGTGSGIAGRGQPRYIVRLPV